MTDTPTGLAVNFTDYQAGAFVQSNVASALDRATTHTIKLTMYFVDGLANDVVQVCVDGTTCHTGTSWEDYFRDVEHNPTRTVDSLLFRTGGTAAPATFGNGFVVDNLTIGSSNTSPTACVFTMGPYDDDADRGLHDRSHDPRPERLHARRRRPFDHRCRSGR